MSEEKNKKISKKFWIIAISLCCAFTIILITGISSAHAKASKIVKKEMNGGSILLKYVGNTSGLTINAATPTSDLVAIQNESAESYFDFSIKTVLKKANTIEYEISIKKNRNLSTINDDDIKVYLEKEVDGTYEKVFGPNKFEGIKRDTKLGTKKSNMILYKNKKEKNGTDNYRLRIWMSDGCLMPSGSYSVDVEINGKAK